MPSLAERSTVSLIFQTLERKDFWRLGVSLALIVQGTFLEMISLGIVIPVVHTVVSGDRRDQYRWLPETFNEMSYTSFVQFLMVALVGMFIVKNLFLLGSSYYQLRTQLSINNRLVQRLFEIYLRQPYEFHLTNPSSLLVRNVQEYSSAVISGGISPTLLLLTDAISGIGLLSVLFLVQPESTALLFGLFVTASVVILKFSRNQSSRWGSERLKHRGTLMAALLGGFGGVKEIKLFGRDREVLEMHRSSLYQSTRPTYLFSVVQGAPRVLLEVVAVGGVALVVVFATIRNQNLQDASVVVALYGVVAFRFLPSVNRVVQSIQQLSFGRAGIEGAVMGLMLSREVTVAPSSKLIESFKQVELQDITYRYPNTPRPLIVLKSLRVQAGEIVGIVGASGSGKSTLVDLLTGILTPSSGKLLVNGREISSDPRYWQDRIGYVPQHVYLMDTSVRRNVAFGLPEKVIDASEVERVLRLANLWDFVQTLPQGLETNVGERGIRLSGGQRQRLGIARALYGNPEVIVLDEATSALDEDTEREIVESMREISRDRTLIVVAHRTSTLAHCSRLIRLEAGRIVQEGSFKEVIGSLPNA